MKRVMRCFVVVGVLSLAATAHAQGAGSCEKMRQEVVTTQNRLTEAERQIGDLDRQIDEANQRLKALAQAKSHEIQSRDALAAQLKGEQASTQNACAACGRLEVAVDSLKGQVAPIAQRLHVLADGIRARQAEGAALDADVDRVQSAYDNLHCANLPPGKTKQVTIDQCHDLFSQWNAMQARIDQLDQSLAVLRQQYQELSAEYQRLAGQIAKLTADLNASCQGSAKLVDLTSMQRDSNDLGAMRGQLDDLAAKVTRARGFRLQEMKLPPPKQGPKLKQLR